MRLVVEDTPKRAMECPFAGISTTPLTSKELFSEEIPVPKFYWKCSLFGGRCKLDVPEYFSECPHLIDVKSYLKEDK